MAHIEDVLLFAIAQDDWPYVWGGESHSEGGFDCSGLVHAACLAAGVKPMPGRTAYLQSEHTRKHGTSISLQDGIATRGALLFNGKGTGVNRDNIDHVALSLGDGRTIEARNRDVGIGSWPVGTRFKWAGLIPGVTYDASKAVVAGTVPPFPGTCRKGDRGPAVKAFQTRLREIGVALVADGDFGPKTDAAIKDFQRKAGLTVDGVAGPKTWDALFRHVV